MKKLILLVTALVLGIALVSSAQPGMCGSSCRHDGPGMDCGKKCGSHGKMPGHPGRMGMGDGQGFQRILEMADKLELTDAQREKLKQTHEIFQIERIDRRASVEKAEVKLRGLMHDDKTSASDINRAIDQVSAMKAEIAKMQFRHQTEMRSVLTEKQQQMLKDVRMERRKEVRVRVFEGEEGEEEIEEEVAPMPHGSGH